MCRSRSRKAVTLRSTVGRLPAKPWRRSLVGTLFTTGGIKKSARLWLIPLLCANFTFAQSPIANPKFKAAEEAVDKDHDRIVRELIQLTEIEAPPFKEGKRAQAYVALMKQSGLANVSIDAEGNVIGVRKGTGDGPLVAIAAHLDTVFPEGTNVKVKRDGTRLSAPGVGDDTRALATLLGMIRAFDAAKIETRSDILFIADVGEEGPGDLRGMKYLFQRGPYKDKIKMFISIDGVGSPSSITTGALGSKRYRVTFKGPGGHSYAAFGIVNPAYALAKAMDKISRMQVPSDPRTTFNVGTLGGGTSVNSIPAEVWMELDLRSESAEQLQKESNQVLALVRQAADEENRARSTSEGKIEVEMKLLGDRPSGNVPKDSPLVRSATAVLRAFGYDPHYDISSTDANIPISMNIPAITIDAGGAGARAHSLDEWIDVEKTSSVRGIDIAMAILLSVAEIR